MTYLLDVNALIALGLRQHEFHERVATWVRNSSGARFATTPITELGFVRVIAQVSTYGLSLHQARQALSALKKAAKFAFIDDDHGIDSLPPWVKVASQTTDGHLAELASSKGAVLATLDAKIARAFRIP